MAGLDDLRRVFRALDAGDGESERPGGNHPVINSILWPFADVSTDRARGGAGVADRSLDHPPGSDDRRRHLGRGEDLSRRRADVRQTAHTAGTGQVVEVQLKGEWGVRSGGVGDKGTRRRGEGNFLSPRLLVSLSPCPLVPLSPCPLVPLSPCLSFPIPPFCQISVWNRRH